MSNGMDTTVNRKPRACSTERGLASACQKLCCGYMVFASTRYAEHASGRPKNTLRWREIIYGKTLDIMKQQQVEGLC